MINHARTLLLNLPAVNGVQDDLEEFITPEYVGLDLAWPLQDIYNIIYGENTTRRTKNYRTHQLMTILHSTELAEYVLRLDPRITYLPPRIVYTPPPIELLTLDVLPQVIENYVDVTSLFDKAPKSFTYAWKSGQLPYRLSGLLLAYIYRIEDLFQWD